VNDWKRDFEKNALAIVNADNINKLAGVRKKIYKFSCKELALKNLGIEKFFNNFHQLKIDKLKLNSFRLNLIKFLSSNKKFKEDIFDIFSKPLNEILGMDVAVQKSLNIVIHQPENFDFSPVHRDAPENSPYEIVLWLPLVNCYKTKSIYLLNKKRTEINLKYLDSKNNLKLLEKNLNKFGKLPNIKFGQAVIFWACLLHSVPRNLEQETRWTFNLRLKNMFTPYGKKGFLDYFEILKKSKLTKLGLDFEKKNY